jgi:hypothetical protein
MHLRFNRNWEFGRIKKPSSVMWQTRKSTFVGTPKVGILGPAENVFARGESFVKH